MYVCLCNGVTEDDVRGSIAAGAGTTREIRTACGMKPGCGVCTKRLFSMLSEHRTASELVDSITGGPAPLEAVPAAPRPRVPALPGAPGLPVMAAATGEGAASSTAA